MYVVKAAETTLLQKIRTENVDEIDTSIFYIEREGPIPPIF
jgi:hypothetical protein